ncbi:MAG: InlB B-repeat-containing protein [Bacilli bacterium]|nr:InlB B-repeat-containing protein [Bacilli bacterium]
MKNKTVILLSIIFFLIIYTPYVKALDDDIKFSSGTCITTSIPENASSSYTLHNSEYVQTGTTYKEYTEPDKVISEDAETITLERIIRETDIYAFFKVSQDKKTVIAYIPNYNKIATNPSGIQILKLLGVYNKKQISCKDTYMTSKSLPSKTYKKENSVEKKIIVENLKKESSSTVQDKTVTNSNNNNNTNSNNKNNNGNNTSIKIAITVFVIFCIGTSTVLLIKYRNKDKDEKFKSSTSMLIITLSILSISALSVSMPLVKTSYAIDTTISQITNLKVDSKTSTSVKLSWSRDRNASSYEICYKKSSESSYSCTLNTTNPTLTKTGLSYDTTYSFKVRGINKTTGTTVVGPYSSEVSAKTYKKDRYYYSSLSATQQKTYDELYVGVKNRKKTISITARYDIDTVDRIYQALYMDHPEFFWIDSGFYYTKNKNTKVVTEISNWYNSTINNYSSNKAKFDAETNKIVSVAKKYATDYEKEQYIAYTLAKTISYDYEASNYTGSYFESDRRRLSQSAYSALVDKNTVCAGYSMAYMHILKQLDMYAFYISGTTPTGNHAWNLVKLDDGYYNVDTTWMRNKDKTVDFSWFNLEQSVFGKQHIMSSENNRSGAYSLPPAQGDTFLGANEKAIINIHNNSESITIAPGETRKLELTVDSNYTSPSKVKWSSSNTTFATVDQNGNVTGQAIGFAEISAKTEEGITSSIPITIDKDSYTLEYELNGGELLIQNPTSYTKNTPTFTLNNPVKEGHTFEGWSRDNNKSLNKKIQINKGSQGDRKYTAHWGTYLTYEYDYGSKKVKVEEGQVVNRPTSEPARSGYTFRGWYSDPQYTTEFDFTKPITRNTTAYAKWEIHQYTITFESNGGTSVSPITANYGTQLTKPAKPTKEGYKFAGWHSDPELTKLYTINKMPGENKTLYAKWVEPSVNVIEYETNGGIAGSNSPTTYITGEEKPLIKAAKEHNVYAGWHTEPALTNRIRRITSDMSGDITLYAKWELEKYTVRFTDNLNSTYTPVQVEYGQTVPRPENPQIKGYTFDGWYTSTDYDEEFDFNTLIDSDTTIYGKFHEGEASTYIIIFAKNNGTLPGYTTIKEGEKVPRPEDPTREGYTFAGWYFDSNFDQKFDFDLIIENNQILYAKWYKNEGPSIPFNKKNTTKTTKTKTKRSSAKQNSYQTVKIPNTGSVISVISIMIGAGLVSYGVYSVVIKNRKKEK